MLRQTLAVPANYHAQDKSILLPILKRMAWDRLLELIPKRIPANDLTLIGTLCSATAFLMSTLLPITQLSSLVVTALILAYLSLDNIDGAQARRTGTNSPLGEFLDHWLDALNLSFLYMSGVFVLQLTPGQAIWLLTMAASRQPPRCIGQRHNRRQRFQALEERLSRPAYPD